ncbi:MAG TPA: branched-chain amino acid ABC transporter permease [Methylomirabilota bacterium]|nr:branched-chain amino acid ABC transporter permease [Methylomirabilota bacterium]
MDLTAFLQATIGGLLAGGVLALIAVGLNLIFGVLDIVNFAHGEFLVLGMYASFGLFLLAGVDPYLSVLLVAPVFFGLGMGIEKLLIHRVLTAKSNIQILLTLGLSLFLQNAMLVAAGPDYRVAEVGYARAILRVGDLAINLPKAYAFVGATVLTVALWLFLEYARLGKAIRAASQDREAALLIGVRVKRVFGIAFGIGIACVAAAGALMTPFYYIAPDVGLVFVLTAFITVVLGGMGSFGGALAGGLLVGVLEAWGALFLPGSLAQVPIFLFFIAVLLFRPTGLFGARAA